MPPPPAEAPGSATRGEIAGVRYLEHMTGGARPDERVPMIVALHPMGGDPADFLLVRAGAPELAMGELDAGLVYAASGAVVDATVVAGRVLMSGGVVEGADEAVSKARECASGIGVR